MARRKTCALCCITCIDYPSEKEKIFWVTAHLNNRIHACMSDLPISSISARLQCNLLFKISGLTSLFKPSCIPLCPLKWFNQGIVLKVLRILSSEALGEHWEMLMMLCWIASLSRMKSWLHCYQLKAREPEGGFCSLWNQGYLCSPGRSTAIRTEPCCARAVLLGSGQCLGLGWRCPVWSVQVNEGPGVSLAVCAVLEWSREAVIPCTESWTYVQWSH